MHRIVLAGAVTSTFATLKKMVEHKLNVVGVMGYEPADITNVSGYVKMSEFCADHDISYFPFTKIGSDTSKSILKELKPDIFFVVGLSQLVPADMLTIARVGNIGFHPTLLPRGRGRAPIAWLILEEEAGAANFFLMGEGADDGPIFVQEPFPVSPADNATSIESKILQAIEKALDAWFPKLKQGIWEPVPQDEHLATYYTKRGPEDGWINWNSSAVEIDKIIRASAAPHPGAFTFLKDQKLLVFSSSLETSLKIQGVNGSVLLRSPDNRFLVQTANGLLWIGDVLDESGQTVTLKVGQKLGYYTELEIYNLKKELALIKNQIKS